MIFKEHQNSIGLDISDRSIKAAQLKRNLKGKLEIQALAKCEIPATVFDDGELQQPKALTQAIEQLLTSPEFGSFNTTYVTACLPETKTFIKMIDIPPMPENEINQAVKWEAEHHIPIPIDDTYWDWQKIGDNKDANARQPVLLAVVPKIIVDSYTQAITAAKLIPLALEVEAIPITRSLLPPTADDPKAPAKMIIDIGATHTSLIVVDLGTIQFTVSLPISGRRVTETVANSLKLSEAQAEKAKIICGLDPKRCHGAMAEILRQMMNNLVNRIQEAALFYSEHFPQGNKIGEIILCGGGSNFKQIDKYLSGKLKLPVHKGNPTVNLSVNQSKLKVDNLISYTTALGLALRSALTSDSYD